MIEFQPTPLPGLVVIQLQVHGDERGFFVERFRQDEFSKHGIQADFVQDNHSRSAPGVVRGLHYQHSPGQAKLVGVTRGRILDVVVDVRADSPTFGRSYEVELSDMNGRLLWIPGGFAHGFCVLGDQPADLLYKVNQYYNPQAEGGIQWNDPELKISWPVADPIVSERDRRLSTFAQYRAKPVRF